MIVVCSMHIKSKGFLTNLIFSRFSGSVTDKGSYTLIQTPSNPGYHWGNYIIFDRPPRRGDLKEWTHLFDREFPYYREPHHYVFAWEPNQHSDGEYQEFLGAGFETDSAVVLTTEKLNPPPHLNKNVHVKKIMSDHEWNQVVELQNLCADPKYVNEYYCEFKQRQMDQYREMSKAGRGFWFGGYFGDKLVGDLGIFYEDGIGRYQSVGTHPDHRRQGICGTLVYQTGRAALNEFGLQSLVMEADPDYHAARIYESVGFQRNEVNHSLSWWKSKGANV